MDAELLLEAAPALPNQAQQPTLQHLEFVGDSRRILTLRYGWTDHGRLVNQPSKILIPSDDVQYKNLNAREPRYRSFPTYQLLLFPLLTIAHPGGKWRKAHRATSH